VLHVTPLSRGGNGARAKLINQRAALFSRNELAPLFASAGISVSTRSVAQSSEPRFAVDDDPILNTDVTLEVLPPAAVTRSIRLAKRGAFARASSALNSAEVVAPCDNVHAALMALHPQEAPCAATTPTFAPPEPFSAAEVRKALMSFPPGSAAGPTGLSPAHLTELIAVVGTPLVDGLCHAASLLAAGAVPAEAAPYFFGAKLSALRKKDGGVRPIACGETLRRLAARCLCSRVRKEAAVHLTALGQVGVGIPHGGEGLLHAARRLAANPPADIAAIKLDFSNAGRAWHDLRPTLPGIAFQGWYLDDGFVAAPLPTLAHLVAGWSSLRDRTGLVLNQTKCELIGAPADAAADVLPAITARHPWNAWELLGTSCGDAAHRQQYLDIRVRAAIRKLHLFSAVADQDPHVGTALIRYCGGFTLLCPHLRSSGFSPLLLDHDAALESVVSKACFPMSVKAKAQSSLPIRRGGLGFRPAAPFALAAFAASAISSAPLAKHFDLSCERISLVKGSLL